MGEQRGHELAHAKSEHLAYGREIYAQSRAPRTAQPYQQRVDARIEDGLHGQAPVAHAVVGADDADGAGDDDGDNHYRALLLDHEVAEEVGGGSAGDASEEEAEEEEA